MRYLPLGILLGSLMLGSCSDEDVLAPAPDDIQLAFSYEDLREWGDSTAYGNTEGEGTIALTGFFAACNFDMTGRLVKADSRSIVVDVEISLVRIICIVSQHSRYKAIVSHIPSGDHRVIMEHVVRDQISGELLATYTVLDSTFTVR